MELTTAGSIMPVFEEFPSIPRLKRGCIITEKLDGTNAQVHVLPDGRVFAASRSRYITPEDDNYGFARWVAEHEAELRDGLGEGRHFGEWWGAGIQRRYGLSEKRFSLFNSHRWKDERPACCHVVPVLRQYDFTSTLIDDALEELRVGGSVAAPGFMDPEGIVVYLPASKQLYKVTLGGDGHKGTAPGTVKP